MPGAIERVTAMFDFASNTSVRNEVPLRQRERSGDGRPTGVSTVVAVCASPGGIPKLPLPEALVTESGLAGDGRAHAKHVRADRAVSLFDLEIMHDLIAEGYPLAPGVAGENLTVANLHVQDLAPGTLLRIGDVVLRLEQPRKPCYVLDAIDPRLKDVIVGRCGYLASVLQGGIIAPRMRIDVSHTN